METSSLEKVKLIINGLKEVMGLSDMTEIIKERPLRVYFGTAPTGRIHIGYLVPLLKIADLLRAGCEVKILFADLHAMLDNLKSDSKSIQFRVIYYEKMIKSILTNLGVSIDKLTFVRGSEFQLSENYTMDVYKLSTEINIKNCKKAGSEVVKQTDNPKLSGLLYPLLQALDEQYLDVDAQLGGIDQRKIFTLATEVLPSLGYKKRIHLMTHMLTAINAVPHDEMDVDADKVKIKMSSSDLNSKIDILDGRNLLRKKVNRMYCREGDITFNPVLDMIKLIIFPLLSNQNSLPFTINRKSIHGAPVHYYNYVDLKEDFIKEKLHPQDLKFGIIDCLNNFMEPIKIEFGSKENLDILRRAYHD